MGETGEGIVAVEAEAVVLKGIIVVVIRSDHMEGAVLAEEEEEEEMMTEIIVSMIKQGGLEAVVLDVEEEVEALWALGAKGIGVLQPGKAVLKEGLRSSNGTGNGNRWTPEVSMIITTTITVMMMNGMVMLRTAISTTKILSSSSSSMIGTKASILLLRSSLSYFRQLTVLLVYKLAVVQELCPVLDVMGFGGVRVISGSWCRKTLAARVIYYYRKDPSVREVRDNNVFTRIMKCCLRCLILKSLRPCC